MTNVAAKRDMNQVFVRALMALDLTPTGPLTTEEYARVLAYIEANPDLKTRFQHAMEAQSDVMPKPKAPKKVRLHEFFEPDDFDFSEDALSDDGLPPLSLMRNTARHDTPQRRAPEPPVQKHGRHSKPNRHPKPNPRARPA